LASARAPAHAGLNVNLQNRFFFLTTAGNPALNSAVDAGGVLNKIVFVRAGAIVDAPTLSMAGGLWPWAEVALDDFPGFPQVISARAEKEGR